MQARPGACTLTAWSTLIGLAIYAGQARCMNTNSPEHSNRISYICRPGACTLTAWSTLIGIAIYAGQARCMNINSLEHSNRNSYICRPGQVHVH